MLMIPDWRRLQAVAYALQDMGATAYLERSHGGHLWLFFSEPLAGTAIRRFGQGMMMFFGLGGLKLLPNEINCPVTRSLQSGFLSASIAEPAPLLSRFSVRLTEACNCSDVQEQLYILEF